MSRLAARLAAWLTETGIIPRWQLLAVYLVITAVFVVGLQRTGDTARQANAIAIRVDRDARIRVNESCATAEQRYKAAVEQLANTYRYVVALSPEERRSTLNQFVIKAVPKQEADLRGLTPAKFCDDPNIGLPEPNPTVPARPPNFPK